MNRINLILIGLLVAQGACIGYQHLGDEDEVAVERGMLFADLDADAVTRVVITEGEGGDDKEVTLTKGADGWVVGERWGAPADGEKLDELLRELAALEVADVISTTGLHAVELGVADADFRKKVVLTDGAGERTLYLGTSGRGSSTHARLGGADEVVAVRNFSTWRVNARPDGWVDRLVVDVPKEDVNVLTLTWPDDELVLTRTGATEDGAAPWLLSDGERQAGVDEADIDALLGKAIKLSASKVLGELDGAASVGDELLRVTLETKDGTVSYALGEADEANNYVLAKDGRRHLMQVGKWAVETLLDASFDELAPAADEGDLTE